MATRQEPGCDDLRWPDDQQIIERALVRCFMPILYFAPRERFFPVDLRSAIRASSLWLVDSPWLEPPPALEKQVGSIDPAVDLPNRTENHFTTIAGYGTKWKEVAPEPAFQIPVPLLDEVYQKYSDGTIGAQLTIYATVCFAPRVPNARLFIGARVNDDAIARALQEGWIINYYMYFPACDSAELKSEGDWSGISLLLPTRPTLTQAQNLNNPDILNNFLPVVTAYYHKTILYTSHSPHFVASNGGFRRWDQVDKVSDQPGGPPTHPIVYVSLGRHNCYYQPISGPVAVFTPWSEPTADDIENGKYTPGPAEADWHGTTVPELGVPLQILCPWLLFFQMSATGCQYPTKFDTSGLSPEVDANDTTASETKPGDKAVPADVGDSYPPRGRWPGGGPPPTQLALKLEYVDLLNDREIAGLWRYPGAWGAATLETIQYAEFPEGPTDSGYFGGVRRPALAAWFLWNLFMDTDFGCGGVASVTPVP